MLLAQNVCRTSLVCTSRLSSRAEDVRQKCECQSSSTSQDDVRMTEHGDRPASSVSSQWPTFYRQCRNYSTSAQKNLRSYYEVLGVTPDCSKEKIKAAFYRLSKVYHPDVNKSDVAQIKFQEIVEAYEVLSNVVTRQQYDSSRKQRKTHYREAKFGQSRYNNSGMPPQGRAMHYNYDSWYKEHYKEAFRRQQQDKQKTREEEEYIKKKEEGRKMPTPFDAKDVPIFVVAASICMLVFHFLKK